MPALFGKLHVYLERMAAWMAGVWNLLCDMLRCDWITIS